MPRSPSPSVDLLLLPPSGGFCQQAYFGRPPKGITLNIKKLL